MKKNITIVLLLALVVVAAAVLLTKPAQKDGENLVFKTDFESINTGEYYAMLKDYYEDDYVYQRFEKDLLTSLEKSPDVKNAAEQQVIDLNENLEQSNDPEKNRANVVLTLQSLGYSGFDEINLYFQNYLVRTEHIKNFLRENMDTYFDQYKTEAKPRYVSHILFKVEDLKNVTDSERNTMNNIRDRINNGETFSSLAEDFSSDGSKDAGGSLGLMDKNTNFVEPFLNAALALENKELSEWVESEFGFHLITVDLSDDETLKKDAYLVTNMLASLPQIDNDAMYQLINDSDIVFQDDAIKASVLGRFTAKGQE